MNFKVPCGSMMTTPLDPGSSFVGQILVLIFFLRNDDGLDWMVLFREHRWTPSPGSPVEVAISARESGEQLRDERAVNIGQPEVASGVAIRQLFVIEAEQVQDGGVQVVHVDRVFDRGKAELIGGAVDMARTDTAPGHPDGEAVVVVIAAPVGLVGAP